MRKVLQFRRGQRASSLALLCCALLTACVSCPRCPGTTTATLPAVPARIETREEPDRPRLRLVARPAEPAVALALAVSVDGTEAAQALAALSEQRLRALGFDISSQPNGAGYVLRTRTADPKQAERFGRWALEILAQPLQARESLPAIRARLSARDVPSGSEGELAVDRCSAELVRGSKDVRLPPDEAGARTQLEQWRKAQTASSVALAAVGPDSLLEAVREGWSDAPDLPDTATAAQRDPWPGASTVAVSKTALPGARLSVTLRTADLGRSLVAAQQLGREGLIHSMPQALEPPFALERVVTVARPRGACLRVDVHASPGTAASAAPTAALAHWLQVDLQRALDAAPAAATAVDDAITATSDASDASAVAAWLALSGRLPAGPTRSALRFSVPQGQAPLADRFLTAYQNQNQRRADDIELRTASEAGHSTLAVLLASPCGTATETSSDAGKHAAMLAALAQSGSEPDFTLAPWITPDAVGLLVQTRPASGEGPELQAQRTARRLAQLLSTSLSGTATSIGRQSLLERLGSPDPDLWQLLELLAKGRLSALEPSGSWTSIGSLIHDDIEGARREFAGGPLRIAVLAGAGQAQGALLARELSLQLAPLRTGAAHCPKEVALGAATGLWRVDTDAAPRALALLAVALPGEANSAQASEAEWTAYLMNRRGGWLERKLVAPGLVTAATAQVLGGRDGRALVLELRGEAEQREAALQAARELLVDLSRGSASEAEARIAQQHFASERVRMRSSRQQRIVQLWRGSQAGAEPTLQSLRQLHQTAFGQERHLVVIGEQQQ